MKLGSRKGHKDENEIWYSVGGAIENFRADRIKGKGGAKMPKMHSKIPISNAGSQGRCRCILKRAYAILKSNLKFDTRSQERMRLNKCE